MTKFTERFARGTEGLDAISTGFLSECPTCLSNFGISDKEDDDGNIIQTAEDIAEELAQNGKINDEGGFSWESCDTCGSGLGGDRHAAHALTEKKDILHLDVCSDCLVYIVNGDVPDEEEEESE